MTGSKTSITFGESMNTDFLSMSDCQCADSFHLLPWIGLSIISLVLIIAHIYWANKLMQWSQIKKKRLNILIIFAQILLLAIIAIYTYVIRDTWWDFYLFSDFPAPIFFGILWIISLIMPIVSILHWLNFYSKPLSNSDKIIFSILEVITIIFSLICTSMLTQFARY